MDMIDCIRFQHHPRLKLRWAPRKGSLRGIFLEFLHPPTDMQVMDFHGKSNTKLGLSERIPHVD